MKKENEVKNAVKSNNGFTLIELLVVVLIIGILSAIALPGYRKSVEKSRVSDALTTMQAVAKSEHGFYLAKNTYTKDFADLDVSLIDKDGNKAEDSSFETVNYTFTLQKDNIKAQRANGEYSLYKFYEEDSVYCLPREHYICQQYNWGVNKQLCKDIENVWHTASSTCYNSQKERCQTEYGNSLWYEDPEDEDHENDFCGYKAKSGTNYNNKTLDEGMECQGKGYYSCQNSTINAGGVCVGKAWDCQNSIINNGGVCKAIDHNACDGSTVTAGGFCIGYNTNKLQSCVGATVYSGGECRGEAGSLQACYGAIINEGAKCTGTGNSACVDADINGGICDAVNGCGGTKVYNGGECAGRCYGATVYDGGICSGSCSYAKISDGGICKSSPTNYCGFRSGAQPPIYSGTGCCCGNYCGNAPKCEDKGISCEGI